MNYRTLKLTVFSILLGGFLNPQGNAARQYIPVEQIVTCHISSEVRLTANTILSCNDDLVVEPGAAIVTQGFSVVVNVSGRLQMPTADSGGLYIDTRLVEGIEVPAAKVLIRVEASSATGQITVGQPERSTNAKVRLDFLAVRDYDHLIYASDVLMKLGGSCVALDESSAHRLPPQGQDADSESRKCLVEF